jgi:hypothetical protein
MAEQFIGIFTHNNAIRHSVADTGTLIRAYVMPAPARMTRIINRLQMVF